MRRWPRACSSPGRRRRRIARWARRGTARDAEALAALRRILCKAHTPDDPLELIVDERGLTAFDGFLSSLQAEPREAAEQAGGGLELAWLGKGCGTVARLAGMLAAGLVGERCAGPARSSRE